jgi:hypothetical protein
MTPTSIRAPGPAGRAGACTEDELRVLADQLQRCLGSQGRWFRWHGMLERLRAFAATHVASVVAMAALAAGSWWLLH